MAEKIVKDTFGQVLNVGDEVVYTYCQRFVKGNIVKFTHAGNVVVDNYPSGGWVYDSAGNRSWKSSTKHQSLGKYKECVKLNVTKSLNLENSDI